MNSPNVQPQVRGGSSPSSSSERVRRNSPEYSFPPVSYQPQNLPLRPGLPTSSGSSFIRGINGSFAPGAATPQSQVTHASWMTGGVDSNASFTSSIQQEEAKLRWDSDEELKKMSKSVLRLQKYGLIVGLVMINAALIYVGRTYDQIYYFMLVLLSSNTLLQSFMCICILLAWLSRHICFWWAPKEVIPDEPEKMIMLLPCYNETYDELRRSLDSLIDQKNIENHPRMIFIVVDGNVRGPGMEKTTQGYLLEDILEPGPSRHFENAYRARDGLFMPVKTQTGFYKGIPYVFVGKRYNQGKRDSLCFARSLLYHFKQRSENVVTMFNNDLFEYIGNQFVQYGLEDVDYLVGMDADTVFDEYCVWEMVKEIRKNPKLVGVCGHVCVDFDGHNWGWWSLYQSVEYSQTQGLRRMFQSRVTGKVNCLPGCCQLIRVHEATFGDAVLRERFGYCPKPNDIMTMHIMGNYSEDSIHASIIFSLFPKKQTAQALKAKAFTIVPQTWKVFLSQRKRWALGSISNEFVMIFRPGIFLIERLQSLIAVVTWAITPFIIAAFVQLIIMFAKRGGEVFRDRVFVGLIAVLFFRYFYSFCIGFWLPRNWLERAQYFVGFFVHLFTSPVMNIIILCYSLFYSDDFKWGKTREVLKDPNEKGGDDVGGRALFADESVGPTILPTVVLLSVSPAGTEGPSAVSNYSHLTSPWFEFLMAKFVRPSAEASDEKYFIHTWSQPHEFLCEISTRREYSPQPHGPQKTKDDRRIEATTALALFQAASEATPPPTYLLLVRIGPRWRASRRWTSGGPTPDTFSRLTAMQMQPGKLTPSSRSSSLLQKERGLRADVQHTPWWVARVGGMRRKSQFASRSLKKEILGHHQGCGSRLGLAKDSLVHPFTIFPSLETLPLFAMEAVTAAPPLASLAARQAANVITQTVFLQYTTYTTLVTLGSKPPQPTQGVLPAASYHDGGSGGLTDTQIGAIAGSIAGAFLIMLILVCCLRGRRVWVPDDGRRYKHRHYDNGSYISEEGPPMASPKSFFRPTPVPHTPRTPRPPPAAHFWQPQAPEMVPGGPKYPTYRALPIPNPRRHRQVPHVT